MSLLGWTAALGIYDLREGSMVRCEIEAYQAALALFAGQLLEVGTIPERMPRELLERWCALYGFPHVQAAGEETLRRALIMLGCGCGWTAQKLEAFLNALGAQVVIEEQEERLLVRGDFSAGFFPDVETLMRTVERLAPVGVEIVNDLYGLSWQELDSKGYTAQELEERGMTWNWFEQFGHLL